MTLPCQQTDRIERIEIAIDKITEQVATMSADIRILTTSVDQALRKIDDHDQVLRGENDQVGMIAAVAQLNCSMNDLYTAMRGEGEKPGLIAVIDSLAKKVVGWEDDKKWLFRLIFGWMITAALCALALLLKP